MATWLLVIILAYFFFSLSNLGDKFILSGPPKPLSYTFFVGLMNAPLLLLVPFISLAMPAGAFFWAAADALVFALGLYFSFSAVEKFDLSRVAIAIGAAQPVIIFILTAFFWGTQGISLSTILAFLLLVLGNIIISLEKKLKISLPYLRLTLISALMFSLDYIFSKIVYISAPFLTGLFWMKILVLAFVLLLLISKKSRKEILNRKKVNIKKTGKIFLLSQACGGGANLLQSYAVFLAPAALLPIANSLRGIQYVFLFLIILFVSAFFPKVLREEISRQIVVRKVFAIILIVAGLALLAI